MSTMSSLESLVTSFTKSLDIFLFLFDVYLYIVSSYVFPIVLFKSLFWYSEIPVKVTVVLAIRNRSHIRLFVTNKIYRSFFGSLLIHMPVMTSALIFHLSVHFT